MIGTGDREIDRVAAVQKRFVIREQLLAAGLGRGAIAHRLKMGRLHPYYTSVYLVGPNSLEPLGREMAAILLFRGHAVLSHRSAAAVWRLLDACDEEVTLTLVARSGHSRPGLRLHRVASLDRRDLRVRDGLPVTAPARTLCDFAGEASDGELEEAVAAATMRGVARPDEIRAAMDRAPRRKGATRLMRLLDGGHASGFSRSRAERRMRSLLRAAELPQPQPNVPLLGYVADFLWPERRLVVEVDGYLFHSSRSSFERDRRRDQRFAAAGYLVIRITWNQLLHAPFAVIARIAQVIAARGA